MSSGFSNPLVGGGGSLVYPSIHSPNYVLAVTGWSINKDGTAQFTGLVLIGGSFTGTNFIINNSGAFFYSGTPAAANLIASIASAAGTDSFGNAFVAGFATYSSNFIAQLVSAGLDLTSVAAGTQITSPGGISLTDSTIVTAGAFIEVFSPETGAGLAQAVVRLQSESADASKPAKIALSATGGSGSTKAVVEVLGVASPADPALMVQPAAAGDEVFGTRTATDTADRFEIDGNGGHNWGSGSAAVDSTLHRISANQMSFRNCDLRIESIGNGLRVRQGTNARQGVATLAGGTVTVANTVVTATSIIVVGYQKPQGTPGAVFCSSVTAGTGFTLKSTSATDTSVVGYVIFEPG